MLAIESVDVYRPSSRADVESKPTYVGVGCRLTMRYGDKDDYLLVLEPPETVEEQIRERGGW